MGETGWRVTRVHTEPIDFDTVDPSEDPLAELELSAKQQERIDSWLADAGAQVDPAEFAEHVMSVLGRKQRRQFKEMIESPDWLVPASP